MLKRVLVFGVTNGIFAGMPLLLMPFLTSLLTVDEYGFYSIFLMFNSFFVVVLGCGGIGYFVRHYYEQDESAVKNTFVNIFIVFLCSFFVVLLVVALWVLFSGIDNWGVYLLAVLAGAGGFWFRFYMTYFQISVQIRLYVYGFLSYVIPFVTVFIWIVLFFEVNVYYVIYCYLIAYVVSLVFMYFLYFNKYIDFNSYSNLKIKGVLGIIVFSFPLLIDSLLALGLSFVDRFMIVNMFSLRDFAIYTVAVQVAGALALAYDSILKVLMPEIMRRLTSKFTQNLTWYFKVRIVYFVLMVVFSVVLSFIGWWFIQLYVQPDYSDAIGYLAPLVVVQFFISQVRIDNVILLFFKRTKLIMMSSLLSLFLSAVFGWFFSIDYGVLGFALGFALAFGATSIMVFVSSMVFVVMERGVYVES